MHPAITSFLADISAFDPDGDFARLFLILDRESLYSSSARALQDDIVARLAQPGSLLAKFDAAHEAIKFAKHCQNSGVVIPGRNGPVQ
jgi:hypothetical protein